MINNDFEQLVSPPDCNLYKFKTNGDKIDIHIVYDKDNKTGIIETLTPVNMPSTEKEFNLIINDWVKENW